MKPYQLRSQSIILALALVLLCAFTQASFAASMRFLDEIRDPGSLGGSDFDETFELATSYNGRVFYPAPSPEIGIELWVSDGTREGTGLFMELNPNNSDRNRSRDNGAGITFLKTIGNKLYFDVNRGPNSGLWSSMGTPETTKKYLDERLTAEPVEFNGRMIANIRSGLYEITENNAKLINDNAPLENGICLLNNGSDFIFLAKDNSGDLEPWSYDGNTTVRLGNFGGNQIVRQLYQGSGENCFLHISGIDSNQVNRRFLIRIEADKQLKELPFTTVQLNRNSWIGVPDVVYFHGDVDGKEGLWQLTGNSNSPKLLLETRNSPRFVTAVNGKVWFGFGFKLIVADPKIGSFGTFIDDGRFGNATISIIGDFGYITAGSELYITDGTSFGTRKLFDSLKHPDALPATFDFDRVVVTDSRPGANGKLILGDSRSWGGNIWVMNPDPEISEYVTGDWVSPELNDQGLLLFNSATAEGDKFIFAAWFTYENGEPLWLAGNAPFIAGQKEMTLPIVRLDGLNFVTPNPDLTANREVIGTMTLRALGCLSLEVEYDLDPFGVDSLELSPLFLNSTDEQCSD